LVSAYGPSVTVTSPPGARTVVAASISSPLAPIATPAARASWLNFPHCSISTSNSGVPSWGPSPRRK
jgi:hypothetical protein